MMLPGPGLSLIAALFLMCSCGSDEFNESCSRSLIVSTLAGDERHCVDLSLSTLEDGSSVCRLFAASSRGACDCDRPGRKPARQDACDLDFITFDDDSQRFDCICELTQLTASDLGDCLSDDSARVDGWCYATDTAECGGPLAAEPVTTACASGHRFKLQSGAALADDETLLVHCVTLTCN